MKQLPEEAIDTYKNILTHTFSMGYFPQKFKEAKIILIPKPNKKGTDPRDYRPISLLEVPGKIYEKILNKRLRHYLESNNMFPHTQHGFRTKRGTETALAIIQEKIANTLANKHQCYLVLRDVAKAFDKVWHNGLRYKLANTQLPDLIIKTLGSFLTQRTGKLTINNTYTGPSFPIRSGVPQGSSLSPTLYTIYTADIPQDTPGSLNMMYADDITQIITHPSKSKNIMARHASREIVRINNYEKKWKIKTNTAKFKIIPLATRTTHPIIIDGQVIPYTNEGTILGLHVNKQGFSSQAKINVKKGQAALNILQRFSELPTDIKLHVVKAYLTPALTYPSYPLNCLSKSSLRELQRTQNRALRFAYNDRYPYQETTRTLHLRANMDTINIILYKRGQKTKEKLETTLQDRHYTDILQNYTEREHGWFRKPLKILKRNEPEPIYT